MFTVKIEGLNELVSKIRAHSESLADNVDDVLTRGIENIAQEARANAPRGQTGALAASISTNTSEKGIKSLTVGVRYGAYVEFGTGIRVFDNSKGFVYSPSLKEYAMEFFVSGKGRMSAIPFLFPAFERQKAEILREIKEILLPKRFKG